MNLAALGVLIRIADELDVASDRNPDLLYDTSEMEGMSEKDVFEFSKHKAIRPIEFTENELLLAAETENPEIQAGVIECFRTIKETMEYCRFVIEQRGVVRMHCETITSVLNDETMKL